MNVGSLKKYKDDCYKALSRDLTEFEKNFLLIAGGILAFSTTFIRDIIKVPEIAFLYLLFISWGLIISSIGFMMYSFLKSADSSDHLVDTVDRFQVENNLYLDSTDLTLEQLITIRGQIQQTLRTSKLVLKRMRNRAVFLFLTGISFFAVFICLNLVKEQEKLASKKLEERTEVQTNLKSQFQQNQQSIK